MSSIVRRMKEDGVLYGQLPNERERMLINMRGALPIVMAEVNANERSMRKRKQHEDGNGTRVAGWRRHGKERKALLLRGVLSSSTVEKETLSKNNINPSKTYAKDKKMPTVIVFDLETTGLSKNATHQRNRVHEFATCPRREPN